MLSYFKYFAVISFILVLVAAFFAGLYFRSFAADSVIRAPIEQDNIILADSFVQQVWCRFEPVFSGLRGKSVARWKDERNFEKFTKLTSTILNVTPYTKIVLYTEAGEQFFATTDLDVVFFDKDESSFGATKVKKDKVVSRLLPSMGMYDESGKVQKGSYVQTHLLISTQNCPKKAGNEGKEAVTAVMEIFHDVTRPWEQLYYFQILVTLGIVITFVLLYLALFLTSRKTEKIINKQHEEKLVLEKAKTIAEAQNQQKSMFLANVSHELRTPLNAIIGFSEIIKDEVMGAVGHPQYKEYINDINSSGVHLLSLINDILDYSKAEARKLDVEVVDVDLSKIAHSCMRLVEPRANEARVKLTENMPERHVVLKADPKRMKQIILNLLSNAVKFTPEDGEVTLSIKEEPLEGQIVLVVTDTGIGISQKDISKAMSPFGQIDSSLSRRYEGTGLGLPLTKKLTEIMGGKFDIKSEVGLGTTVTLIFSTTTQEGQTAADEF